MSDWTSSRSSGPRDWALIEEFLKADLDDRRRARRWRWFRRLLLLIILAALAVGFLKEESASAGAFGPHTAVVAINGEIAADSPANAQGIIDALTLAFESTDAKAVVLSIDSPGGSPVQADEVYREVRRLRKLHPAVPVYAVIGDTGASGAYYIAVAADRIFVNPSSLVGSIGVIMPGFGVPNLIQKLGVEDRTLTAGEHKNLLSPTRPVDPVEREHVQSVLDAVHRHFIAAVKAGLDVYDREPMSADHPFTRLDNVTLIPHLGYVVEDSYRHFYAGTIEDIEASVEDVSFNPDGG